MVLSIAAEITLCFKYHVHFVTDNLAELQTGFHYQDPWTFHFSRGCLIQICPNVEIHLDERHYRNIDFEPMVSKHHLIIFCIEKDLITAY